MPSIYLAIDIGGTQIKWALLVADATIVKAGALPTPDNIHGDLVRSVCDLVHAQVDAQSVAGVGLATAGTVRREDGAIVHAGPTIAHYTGVVWEHELKLPEAIPLAVENDANAALLGELWRGVARGRDQVYGVTLGTGIGGAYYASHIIDGAHLQADAIGFALRRPADNSYLETRASVQALQRRLALAITPELSVVDAFARARQGDPSCLHILHAWAADLAEGLAQVALIRDPALIVIGGAASAQGDFLRELITQHLAAYLPPAFEPPELKISQLGNDAALFGAIAPFVHMENK